MEHIYLYPTTASKVKAPNDADVAYFMTMDFLGKDAMRYKKEMQIPLKVFRGLESCMYHYSKDTTIQRMKDPKDQLFDLVSTISLNKHLKTLMPGLSAKVC